MPHRHEESSERFWNHILSGKFDLIRNAHVECSELQDLHSAHPEPSQSTSEFKVKLDALIKKLEKLSEKMSAVPSNSNGSVNTTTLQTNYVESTTTKTVKLRDPRKSYCNATDCPVPTCSETDKSYYGRLINMTNYPPVFKICESKICIGTLMKMHSEVPNYCCVNSMTHMSINSDKMLDCAKEVHIGNKIKLNSSNVEKYWTSAKWSQSCEKYVWCPEKEIVGADAKWKKGFPKVGAGNCVGIQLGSSKVEENGLFNTKCTDFMKLFCIETDVP